MFVKPQPESTIPLHFHPSAEGMALVDVELYVTDGGQKNSVLKADTYAYGPSKLPHAAYGASAVPCVLFIGFESPLDAIQVMSSTP